MAYSVPRSVPTAVARVGAPFPPMILTPEEFNYLQRNERKIGSIPNYEIIRQNDESDRFQQNPSSVFNVENKSTWYYKKWHEANMPKILAARATATPSRSVFKNLFSRSKTTKGGRKRTRTRKSKRTRTKTSKRKNKRTNKH